MKSQQSSQVDTVFTLKEVFLMFFGFGYIVNHRRKEIHRIGNKQKNCHIDLISAKNREYVTRRKALKLIKKFKYNGCRWCWPDQDKG